MEQGIAERTKLVLCPRNSKIVQISVGVKGQQNARLSDPVGRGARGALAYAVGDQVLDKNDPEQSVLLQILFSKC